jgi:hypothetical protein
MRQWEFVRRREWRRSRGAAKRVIEDRGAGRHIVANSVAGISGRISGDAAPSWSAHHGLADARSDGRRDIDRCG